jgi:probable RNA-binding protein EIF1AD
MPRSKRKVLEAAEEASTPPDKLADGQVIAQVIKMAANNLVEVKLPDGKDLLVELSSKFRNAIWIRRGGYVLIDTKAFEHRENKLDGEIMNVVRDEKDWRKQAYW